MKKIFFVTLILVISFSFIFGCSSQPNSKTDENEKSPTIEKKVVVIDDCWKEFTDSTAAVRVKFCGEPKKDILSSTFNGLNIKINSYLVLDTEANGNARYFLGWFEWKLKSEDQESLQKFYDEYIKDKLKADPSGSLKESKEIFINGKIGREFTLIADDSNSLTQRIVYSNGKVMYAAFLPDELSANKAVQNKSRQIFFDSFQILESK